jgi:[ribosomal protein S5]-alanine N-acetyltransferase
VHTGSRIFQRTRTAVTLRAPTHEDCDEFIARTRASTALHHPWVTPPATRGQYDSYLRRVQQSDFCGYLVCAREDGSIVGYFTLGHIVRDALQSAYLGYAAFAPFDGRGHMTEGMRLVLDDAFDRLRLHRVEANIQPGNARSLALAQRCGLQREGFSPAYLKIGGVWRDHERWAIRADQPRQPLER